MAKRKQWSEVSMAAAVECVIKENNGLRQTARLYNIPVETLRRHVNAPVGNSGPGTVFTEEEEEQLVEYFISMADMGFGLSRELIMNMAFTIAERFQRKHPFNLEKRTAGRSWFEGFMKRHPKLTIRSPQPLSYCRALNSNKEVLSDFFGKLGALYGKLNLISKPMQIYNSDETGVTVVHKPNKVVAQLGRRNVYSISAAEKGRTHTVLSCVSACGYVLPPMMVYPRKRPVPPQLREGCYPNTLFGVSETGWINSQLYVDWFFIQNIPSNRPVLLIQDGHHSHVSIELIELARSNDIHLLCLPAHTSHLLQPLDVGVFKSFKSNFNKACSNYISKNPGRVITADILAALVGEAYPVSFTPVNIMSGFKKSGIWPINPGEVTDRTAPSTAFHIPAQDQTENHSNVADSPDSSPIFSPELESLFRKRYEEGYNVYDPEYIAWVKVNHPEMNLSTTSDNVSDTSSEKKSQSSPSDILSEILVLPNPKSAAQKKSKRKGLNTKAVCVTDDEVFDEMKKEKQRKKEEEQQKLEKQAERTRKKLEREKMKKEKEEMRRGKKNKKKEMKARMTRSKQPENLPNDLKLLQICEDDDTSYDSDQSDAICPKCGISYLGDSDLWVSCDSCERWFDFRCTTIKSKVYIPDNYYCEDCV